MVTLILLALFATSTNLLAQTQSNESLGLPGDNLNLYAVMKLFQESETLEGFEKGLNDPGSHINNLDLNGDNLVDYIRIIDNVDGDVHTIVLQVAINQKENQDVAVFTVQRDRNGQVHIQLTGDESLYGPNYIIEPNYNDANEGQTPNPGYMGNGSNGQNITVITTSPEVIATWPVIRFIYMPNYIGWHSAWHYNYYPSYWNPWSPFYWDYYYGYQHNYYNDYYGHYRRTQYHSYTGWNDHYYNTRRSQSPNVSVRIREGSYKSTYSRPDQRKDGEALYRSTDHGQNTGRPNQSSGNNAGRRPDANSSTNRQPTGTGTNSRPANSVTNKPEPRAVPQQNNVNTQRTPANTNQSGNRPTQQQNNNNVQRPASTTNQTGNKPIPQQNIGTPRRAPTDVINQPAVKSSSPQNSGSTRQNPERAGSNSQPQHNNVTTPAESRRPAPAESGRPAAAPKEQKSEAPAAKPSGNKGGNSTRTESNAKPPVKNNGAESAKPERER